jgi:hypothetical protein
LNLRGGEGHRQRGGQKQSDGEFHWRKVFPHDAPPLAL